jgi:endonuclease-3
MTRGQQASPAARIAGGLAAAYPDATCELTFANPYELLVATILSAQCTDARVNQVTPALFARFPDAAALAGADLSEVEALIRPTGFFRNKARSLLGMARALVERHGGSVPADMDALTALPGVGRKTANVVLGTAFGVASGVVVDTHVARLARRLGLSRHEDPVAIEADLMALFPPEQWVDLAHRLILHGRRVCAARKPACDRCTLSADCPKHGV